MRVSRTIFCCPTSVNEGTVAPVRHKAFSNQALQVLCLTECSHIGVRSSDRLCGNSKGRRAKGAQVTFKDKLLRNSVHRRAFTKWELARAVGKEGVR